MVLAPAVLATDVLIAVGTVGAVLVALFLQAAVPYWRRPKLAIPSESIPEAITDIDENRVEGVWWDIPVKNVGRRDAAVRAQVLLTEVSTQDGIRTSVPLRSLKWTHQDDGITDIPAGIVRSFQLAEIKPKGQPPLRLGIYPPIGGSERNELAAGTYHVELAVVAQNAPATYYKLDVVFSDGGLSFPNGIIKTAPPSDRHATINVPEADTPRS